jgi:putative spermidine/putrescine transport system permease protein
MAARGRLAEWLWLAPAGAILLPFFVLPIGLLLRNSLLEDDSLTGIPGGSLGLRNYAAVLLDPFYSEVFLNTLGIAALIGVLAALVGYPYAVAVARASGTRQALLLWAVYTPLLVSVIVRALGWIAITADGGVINQALLALGAVGKPLRILYEVEGMTLGMLHRYLPLMVLPVLGALQKIPRDLATASSTLGAGGVETFLRVTLPLSLPGVVIGFQLVFASVLSDYVLPFLMGTTRFRMLAPALYDEAVANQAMASASAMAVSALLLVLAILAGSALASRRLMPWARAR